MAVSLEGSLVSPQPLYEHYLTQTFPGYEFKIEAWHYVDSPKFRVQVSQEGVLVDERFIPARFSYHDHEKVADLSDCVREMLKRK